MGVILDLFGTLVAAPSAVERRTAAAQFAEILRVSLAVVESVLSESWQARHDGQLTSATEVAAHLATRCNAAAARAGELEMVLAQLAHARLRADATLLQALEQLQRGGVRLAVLSDASPDIAEAWSRSDHAPYFDAVVFSCRAGAVKPDRLLFRAVLQKLGVAPHQSLYCGDGGGDELAGAERAGMRAVRVERRGGPSSLVFGETVWSGTVIPDVEALPSLLDRWGKR
jgi:putative hydrolase of the HAD superfamily